MPIEIKELHIKISVNENKTQNSQTASKGKQEDVAEACVEEVMHLIEQKKER